jgi:hypothetical protein
MANRTGRKAILGVVFLLGIGAAWWAVAQEPATARLAPGQFSEDGFIELVFAWRFHPGDDPGYVDPRLDDRAWVPADPRLPAGEPPRSGWTGTGWFRRHLRVDRGLWDKPLLLRVEAPGTTEVFLDGERVLVVSGPGAGTSGASTVQAGKMMAFSAREDHVIAVRRMWTGGDEPLHGTLGLGFHLMLEKADVLGNLSASRAARERRYLMVRSVFTALPVFLGVLHLALFGLYPKARENLFYALWMLSFAWIVVTDLSLTGEVSETWRFVAEHFNGIGVGGVLLFNLFTYFAVRTRPFPKSAVFLAVAVSALAAACAMKPARFWPWFWYPCVLGMTFEVLRIEIRGPRVRRSGVTPLLVAMGIQLVVLHIAMLTALRLLPQLLGVWGYFLVLFPLALTMSFGLARDVAQTNIQLESKLVEVQALSSQVIEHEREAHAQELRSRLLEADNDRKTRELEAARSLQLSMLPVSLPRIPGLDVAAAMTTATEVGGDYYDFRVEPDGSLLIALGDATGHGVSAGIVVTAIKAMFTSLEGPTNLPGFLARCSSVLQNMKTGRVRMCLALALVRPDRVTLCSAAMPPMLVHRAADDSIEEVVTEGLPLGTGLIGRYEERTTLLQSGDSTTDLGRCSRTRRPIRGPVGVRGCISSAAHRRRKSRPGADRNRAPAGHRNRVAWNAGSIR